MGTADPGVVHNVAGSRFEVVVNGQTAHLDYELVGDRFRLVHIEVPPALRGHKHAEDLTRASLEYAGREQLRVVPICPFVREFLARTPEYLPLVDDHWRPLLR
jgi:hypothetical protein